MTTMTTIPEQTPDDARLVIQATTLREFVSAAESLIREALDLLAFVGDADEHAKPVADSILALSRAAAFLGFEAEFLSPMRQAQEPTVPPPASDEFNKLAALSTLMRAFLATYENRQGFAGDWLRSVVADWLDIVEGGPVGGAGDAPTCGDEAWEPPDTEPRTVSCRVCGEEITDAQHDDRGGLCDIHAAEAAGEIPAEPDERCPHGVLLDAPCDRCNADAGGA